MPVQKRIDIVRWLIGRNVLKTESQSAADKIDDQWPFEIAIAISAHVSDPGSNRAKLVENGLCANVSQMPDFICIFGDFLHFFRQAIVCIRQNKNAHPLFRSFLACHARATLPFTLSSAPMSRAH